MMFSLPGIRMCNFSESQPSLSSLKGSVWAGWGWEECRAYIQGGRWGRGLALSCTAWPQLLPTMETIPGEPCPGRLSGPPVLPYSRGGTGVSILRPDCSQTWVQAK